MDLNIKELKQGVSNQQGPQDQDKLDIGYLRQQLFMATAVKQLAAMKLPHEGAVSDLRRTIQMVKYKAGEVDEENDGMEEEPDTESPVNEVAQLWQHIAELSEERNMLIKTLDWEKVQWRSSNWSSSGC